MLIVGLEEDVCIIAYHYGMMQHLDIHFGSRFGINFSCTNFFFIIILVHATIYPVIISLQLVSDVHGK
jgi:hypothetical protein